MLLLKSAMRRAWSAGPAGRFLEASGTDESAGVPWKSRNRREIRFGDSRSTAGFGASRPHLYSVMHPLARFSGSAALLMHQSMAALLASKAAIVVTRWVDAHRHLT